MNVTVASASRVSADSPGFSTARRDRHPHTGHGMAGKDRTPPTNWSTLKTSVLIRTQSCLSRLWTQPIRSSQSLTQRCTWWQSRHRSTAHHQVPTLVQRCGPHCHQDKTKAEQAATATDQPSNTRTAL